MEVGVVMQPLSSSKQVTEVMEVKTYFMIMVLAVRYSCDSFCSIWSEVVMAFELIS
jgi:hypothetical protein